MRNRTRGFTSIEQLVATVIMGLIFNYFSALLGPGFRAWINSEKKVVLQQQTLMGTYRLLNELKESHRNSIVIRKYDPSASKISSLVCFVSAADTNGSLQTKTVKYALGPAFNSGEPEWQKYIIYYLDDKARLRRCETPNFESYKDPDSMKIRGEPALFINADNLISDKIVASQIESLSFSNNVTLSGENGSVNIDITACDKERNFRTHIKTGVGARYCE